MLSIQNSCKMPLLKIQIYTTIIMIPTDLNFKCPTIAKVNIFVVGHAEIVIVGNVEIVVMGPINSYCNKL